SVGELVGDEETAFAAHVHALEPGVPAGDNAVCAGGKGDGFGTGMIVGGVEFGAVGEPAGVFDGVPLDFGVGFRGAEDAGFGERAGAGDDVDVAEGVGDFGDACDLGDVGRGRRCCGGCCGCGVVDCGRSWFCGGGGGGLWCGGLGGGGCRE